MARKKCNKLDFSFVPLPREVFKSKEFAELRPCAVKLLIDLYTQYNGNNNGNYCLAWKIMQPKGWRSKATLERAKKELLAKSFIEETRKGRKGVCSLYAVSWLDVDYCNGKLDFRNSNKKTNAWKKILLPKQGQSATKMRSSTHD